MRREQLLLHAADRQDTTPEGDLPRHRDIAPDPPARERRHDRGRHGHARRRSVLRNGPGRYVDVHRVVLEESLGDPELALVRTRRAYEQEGYSRQWIDQRMRSVSARHELTSEW